MQNKLEGIGFKQLFGFSIGVLISLCLLELIKMHSAAISVSASAYIVCVCVYHLINL